MNRENRRPSGTRRPRRRQRPALSINTDFGLDDLKIDANTLRTLKSLNNERVVNYILRYNIDPRMKPLLVISELYGKAPRVYTIDYMEAELKKRLSEMPRGSTLDDVREYVAGHILASMDAASAPPARGRRALRRSRRKAIPLYAQLIASGVGIAGITAFIVRLVNINRNLHIEIEDLRRDRRSLEETIFGFGPQSWAPSAASRADRAPRSRSQSRGRPRRSRSLGRSRPRRRPRRRSRSRTPRSDRK